MKKYDVINYHVTNRCNYHCVYCFGKFPGQNEPSPAEVETVIDNICAYFKKQNIPNGRINFAGGEPLLYPHLDELIDYAHSLGISVSLVTNGSLLTAERIRRWCGKVSCIGISIDSVCPETDREIGRCCKGQIVPMSHWAELAPIIHQCGIKLKINTVVSALNDTEDLSPLYTALKPDRIKLFQMHLVRGVNDRAENLQISEDKFDAFVQRHSAFSSVIVPEPCKSMENSYLMINPEGYFQLNDGGKYKVLGDCKTTSLSEIIRSVPLDADKFDARYTQEVEK